MACRRALVRVERGAHIMGSRGSRVAVPDGWLFAGSVLFLRPGTSYELRLTLDDPDGATSGAALKTGVTRLLRAKTRSEPRLPAGMRKRHVVPGTGGGSGTSADPFRGLATAQKAAVPGDLFLLRAGVYPGHWVVNKSGTPDQPIVWRGTGGGATGAGSATIDGQGESARRPPHAIEASGTHDVWFEDLAIENALHGVTIHDAVRMVVRRCHIRKVDYGINAARDTRGIAQDHFIADNLIEGPSTWPRTKGIEDARGIQLTGEGHVVCYNGIRGFADAIDTFGSARCAAIDFHNNDLSELTDDGIELDYSERNTRCFWNRLTNVFQGISMQPVYGGPVYVFRNVMDNVAVEPFKLHNSPSGCLIFHNTCVKNGVPALLWTSERVRHSLTRNNLFVGTAGNYAFECTAPMVECDFDYDGFGGGPFRLFLRWNGTRYASLAEVHRRAPVFKHALQLDAPGLFASGVLPPVDVAERRPNSLDFRLAPGQPPSMRAPCCQAGTTASTASGPTWGPMSWGTPCPITARGSGLAPTLNDRPSGAIGQATAHDAVEGLLLAPSPWGEGWGEGRAAPRASPMRIAPCASLLAKPTCGLRPIPLHCLRVTISLTRPRDTPMPSPFPGMNPYLEQDDAWHDFRSMTSTPDRPTHRLHLTIRPGPRAWSRGDEREAR